MGSLGDVRHRDGSEFIGVKAGVPGFACWWDDSGDSDDIVAYRTASDEQTSDHGEVCEVGL
jgi:hypothetical protein